MNSFFNPDNWLWRGFGRLADYFFVSACWLVCCIPLVTAGSACIALYDAVAHSIRGGEGKLTRRFFQTFRKELGRGIALTLLWGVICLILNLGYQLLAQMASAGTVWSVLSTVYFTALFLPLGWMCWLVAVESRFTYSFAGLHKTTLLLTFGHLPHTLAVVVILVIALNVLLNLPFLVIFLPGAIADLQGIFIEKVFAKYTPSEAE